MCTSVCAGLSTHVVFLEEAEVADDPDPHQQGGGAQQDPTHVVRRDALGRQHTHTQVTTETVSIKLLSNCYKMSTLWWWMNELHLYCAFLTGSPAKCFTILLQSQQSPIHTHIHPPATESTMQGDSHLTRSSQGEVSPRHSEEPGVELATFRLPANPLYLLSHMPPQSTLVLHQKRLTSSKMYDRLALLLTHI